MVCIITFNYAVLEAVSVVANAGHPSDVAYTGFTQLKLPKSMVSILTSSKSRYHELCCGGSHAYPLCCKFCGGKYNNHQL